MSIVLKAHIVRIGNSRGIRIPKALLDQANLRDEIELELGEGQLIIRPARVARAGWEDQFKAMTERGDDALLDPVVPTSTWDETEWEW